MSPSISPYPSPRAPATAISPLATSKTCGGGVADVELPPPDKMHQVLIRIICKLLREQPAVVILEDAHDIDEQSWKVFVMVVVFMSLTNDILHFSTYLLCSKLYCVGHPCVNRSGCSHFTRDDTRSSGPYLKTSSGSLP